MYFLGIALLVIACIGIALIIWGLIEASWVKITRDTFEIGSSGTSQYSSSGDKEDLRILFFSDVHAEACMVPPIKLARIIAQEHENGGLDAVIFGGDTVNHARHALKGYKYMIYVSETCKALKIPFWGVTGNHDYPMELEDIGALPMDYMGGVIKYLKSRVDGRYIAFGGVGDTGRHDRIWFAPPTPSDEFNHKSYIMLAHNPDIVLHMPPELPFKVNGIISGHIHGGQIRTPFKLEFLLRKDELPHMGIISGIHEVNGIKLFISKGIGCVLVPIRFFCRPEVNILSIKVNDK